jgi:transcription antitermination factor NusG
MENKEREKRSQIKPGDEVTFRETPRTKELRIANSTGVVKGVDGEEIYVLYTGFFGLSGPYKMKIDEVEKVI